MTPSGNEPVVQGLVELTADTRDRRQQVTLNQIVPGRTSTVVIPIANRLARDIQVQKIVVSCGCMVVKDFRSLVPSNETSGLSLQIRSGLNHVEERRTIDIRTSDNEIWTIELLYKPMRVFELDKSEFVLENDKTIETIVRLDKAFESKNYSTKELRCTHTSAIVQELSVEPIDETQFKLKIKVDSSRFGLKSSAVEQIEIATADFATSVPVLFRNPKPIRVSPEKCQPLKLINGGQRFFVIGTKGVGELGWRWVDTSENQLPVNVVNKSDFANGEIVEIEMKDEDVLACRRIEVFPVNDSKCVLATVLVD